jgi:hypothetical protein
MKTIIGKQNQFHIKGITAMSVTPRNVKLISVTSFLETDEIKIYPLYGISRFSQENETECYRI